MATPGCIRFKFQAVEFRWNLYILIHLNQSIVGCCFSRCWITSLRHRFQGMLPNTQPPLRRLATTILHTGPKFSWNPGSLKSLFEETSHVFFWVLLMFDYIFFSGNKKTSQNGSMSNKGQSDCQVNLRQSIWWTTWNFLPASAGTFC